MASGATSTFPNATVRDALEHVLHVLHVLHVIPNEGIAQFILILLKTG